MVTDLGSIPGQIWLHFTLHLYLLERHETVFSSAMGK